MGAPVLTRRGSTRSDTRPDHQHDTGDDRETVTVDAALTPYEAETKRTECTVHRGRGLALRNGRPRWPR